ncbi:YbhB/YbcL family Raf kinase inhibitor-like protein [Aliarcobacter butzleri]|uniref:YbhB/YbcL family Raf kinase inhibitor-like protein n=1 Tax=Aliarcobacter butzleri L351 TaxID=1447259 RepID=A0A837J316_9BACT|nr:YbhB/YbcL family Raf kinase inhibitor-like protein [Aliarcobacter butzleri]KLD99837.1 YbhB/YbcL family Raf kinase inhibitor-like protein [Aliarcobacter butzleri L351]KLE12167.1 YbhB/YbcL family Raf kinase inhibitor-like protein [Aliarcobacter butzleri L350]MDN5046866.1 YbhB/YbcL family Raf kinase inhibitor-like protein [Aliarcobacter butzleri]MDN5059640.1 YbhB/YbcL family Raf kinase inhibitor-like protein [Aliarcobacter butzleri]MDN5110035.1 YbhB/YbcL family Raf kinase inhibitor-like protei
MKKTILGLICCVSFLLANNFTLTSSDLKGQLTKKQEFNGFGCSGENISPQLSWENAPKGTKSFAITVYDPDAPTGSGWWHWVVFDILSNKTTLASGFGNSDSKEAIQSITDYGKTGFGGACPPVGDKAHRYIFTVHALDIETLGLDKNTNAATVGYYINSHSIAKASIISYYNR